MRVREFADFRRVCGIPRPFLGGFVAAGGMRIYSFAKNGLFPDSPRGGTSEGCILRYAEESTNVRPKGIGETVSFKLT